MSVGNAYENAVLDALLGDDHIAAAPDTVYLAVYDASDPPGDDGGGTELDIGRVAVANDSTHWPDADGSLKENGTRIQFDAATSNQPSSGHWALHAHPTNDDVFIWGRFSDVIGIDAGEQLTFEPGSIVIPCD